MNKLTLDFRVFEIKQQLVASMQFLFLFWQWYIPKTNKNHGLNISCKVCVYVDAES